METLGERAVATALRKLMPLIVLMHVIAWIDRLNISFAHDQLETDLALSSTAFGLASGIFFVGFVLFQVPSNLILHGFGARRWLATIMVAWGTVACATAFVWNAESLVVLRFLLGVAEAGFFPGVVLFLSLWFPPEARGRAMAAFLGGIAIAFIVGAPTAGALLELDGVLGLDGWQWLFLVQGSPAIVVGVYALRRLPDRPSAASWLPAEEAEWLERRVVEARDEADLADMRAAIRDARVRFLTATFFCLNLASYGLIFWLPDITERVGDLSDFETGLLTMIPFSGGVIGLIVLGRRADREGGHRRLLTFGLALGAACTFGLALAPPVVGIPLGAVSTFGLLGVIPVFWALPTRILRDRAAAGGIALISSIGVSGGLFGPVIVGAIEDATGSLDGGIAVLGGSLAMAALLAWLTPVKEPAAAAPAPAAADTMA
jgi:MFS transporter, ACS family, tartrate transporter